MAVLLNDIQLGAVQSISIEEDRALVEQKVPGFSGSLFQDIGRKPVMIRIEGTLFGESALSDLEKIRSKFKAGEPIPFTTNITTAVEVSQVLVKDLVVNEVAGKPHYFRYLIRLAEYIFPADTGEAEAALAIETDIGLEAKEWGIGVCANIEIIADLSVTLTSIPDFGNPIKPLMTALDGVKKATENIGNVAQSLKDIFGL